MPSFVAERIGGCRLAAEVLMPSDLDAGHFMKLCRANSMARRHFSSVSLEMLIAR